MSTFIRLVPERDHVAHLFREAVRVHGHRPATRIREQEAVDPGGARGGWVWQTYQELGTRVEEIASALLATGIGRGERIAVLAHNCPEWTALDLAACTIGAALVPLYATSTPDQISYIVRDAEACLAFAGDRDEAERFRSALTGSGGQAGLNGVRELISFGPTGLDGVRSLAEFAPAGSAGPEQLAAVGARMAELSADDLFSLIYTSGTTGDPRGVMISHRALLAELRALDAVFQFGPEEQSLCFLPLSHALERAWSINVMSHGCLNTYCPNTRKISELLVEARPSLLVSVPKLFETVLRTARGKVADSGVKSRIFEWALRVGGQKQRALRKGRRPALYWRAQFGLADRLVLHAVRDAMGGPKTMLVCGGAALRVDVEEFFSAVGLPVLTGYGLTEACPLVSFNSPRHFKVGSAGRVMANGELRIADQSEIWYRGPNLMDGYWNNPEATAAAFGGTLEQPRPADAWLRTGDIGYVDADGYLFITDRLKDIIVTSGGKNIAPQAIESLVMSDPLFEQAVLLGDDRPFLTMLVKPSLAHLGEIAERLSLPTDRIMDHLDDPRLVEEVRRRAVAVTSKLPSHEQFKDLRVLFEEFTLENGLLTPTLKVKRREVEKRFSDLIEDMYAKATELRERIEPVVRERFGGEERQPEAKA